MILFNLLISQNIAQVPTSSHLFSKDVPKHFRSSSSLIKSLTLAYVVKEPSVLMEHKKSLAARKFFRENYWQQLVNIVWHKSILMSAFDKASSKYIIELSHINAYRDQNTSKNLVSKFSKSLLEGSIVSSFSSSIPTHTPLLALQYKWPKYLKACKSKMLNLFNSSPYGEYLKYAKRYLSRNITLNHFPLFVVSNYLGQMIISEPSTELIQKKNFWTHSLSTSTANQFHQGWFFTSFDDAKEYMDSINKQYGLQKNHLKVFVCNFSALYEIQNEFGHQVYFRLMPDLKEVSSLIKTHRYNGGISFHKKQKYGATYFQGQPIYIIKSNGNNANSDLSVGRYLEKYDLVFANYETASNVFKKINSKSSNDRFKIPNIIVYNLESFIEDEIFGKTSPVSPSLLVPSQNSYSFTKKYLLRKKTSLAYNNIENYISLIRLWSKRILWSLTSKQPHGW